MLKECLKASALVAVAVAPATSQAEKFLRFPVSGYGPYDKNLISTVLDHEVPHDLTLKPGKDKAPYGVTGGVLSFTGELFLATAQYPPSGQGCYPKPKNSYQSSTWSPLLQKVYYGTDSGSCRTNKALNYDNHPGYDYRIDKGTNVYPAYGGKIVFTKCINTFKEGYTCEQAGAVAIDHGNGFVTQYLHMSDVYYGSAAQGLNQDVAMNKVIGKVSNKYPVTLGVHLHFEVLQRKSKLVNASSYYDRSNWMIVDPYGYKATSYRDVLQSNPGCLWYGGCQ
ncbi:MAG TPA: M23 family metallopeptidase [Allosphingosinicella sp.]|nr:M23 family metallopeptidase [Allosphingosinicella sp.]